jgi:hypothetical protein
MTVIPEIMKAGTNNFVSGHSKGTNSTMLHKRAWFDEAADGLDIYLGIHLGGSLVAEHLPDIYRNGDFLGY